MNTEILIYPESKQTKSKFETKRKIYNRDDFFRYYYCSKEIPDYLETFQYLYNNYTEENWCKKPLPKFDELIPEVKNKQAHPLNRTKIRQRTLSNRSSGDSNMDYSHDNSKNGNRTNNGSRFYRFGSVRGNSPNDMMQQSFDNDQSSVGHTNFIDSNDFVDETNQWYKSNNSKPYSHNHMPEDHWKKWTADATDKNKNIDFNRPWIKKNDTDNRHRNPKNNGRHSVPKSGDQTEDIWQDDWDTEMKSDFGKQEIDLNLDSYELPKSSILSGTLPTLECDKDPPGSLFISPTDPAASNFNQWFYRDLLDKVQGPFSSENMANWLAKGYFNPSTFIRRSCDERFLLFAEYRALYRRIPFTAGPAVPPIHSDTPIEIDINQLLIGVDSSLRQQVINCATTLPIAPQSQMGPTSNSIRLEEKLLPNSVAMLSLMEEKRMLEESRAELERERERMTQDQVQWRKRIEAELKAQIKEEMKQSFILNDSISAEPPTSITELISTPKEIVVEKVTSTEEVMHQTDIMMKPIEPEIPIPTKDNIPVESLGGRWEIDEDKIPQVLHVPETNDWFSTKEMKHHKKNKKAKAKEARTPKEEKEVVSIPQVKHPDIPTDSRISFVSRETILNPAQKETAVETKGRPIRFELNNRKNESNVSWNSAPLPKTPILPVGTKSFLEIQAEEFENEKKVKESQKSSTANDAEVAANKDKSIKLENGYLKKESSVTWEKPAVHSEEMSFLKIQEAQKPKTTEKKHYSNDRKSINGKISKDLNLEKSEINKSSLVKEETRKEKIEQEESRNIEIDHKKITVNPLTLSNESVDSRKPDVLPSSWNAPSKYPTTPRLPVSKSLKEIQAEETLKAKQEKQSQLATQAYEMEANKVTSFKESLLKNKKHEKLQQQQQPMLPVGKSIWDMLPGDNVAPSKPAVQVTETLPKKDIRDTSSMKKENVAKKEDSNATSTEHLTSWCIKKLEKFSEKFDVETVIELLILVPNEEVMELAVQLLDNSKFTSTFVVDFINKRQELSDNVNRDSWQTVKKPITTVPSSANTNSKTKKSKSKKKVVVVETKFR